MENLDPSPPPPPSSQIKDGKMVRFCPSRAFILDLGGMGVCCSILFWPRLYFVLVLMFARISISSRRFAGRLVGFLITSARLSLFELSVLILRSIYAPVVEFHEGPYKGLFGFLSYGVYVFLNSSSGVIFARALYLKVLGHEPFSG